MKYQIFFRTLALALLLATVSSASLLTTDVTGSLTFSSPINFFHSGNGLVSGGCQNSGAGTTTVTVVDPTSEFCFAQVGASLTANFSGTSLSVSGTATQGTSVWAMPFLFSPGLVTGVSETSDTFPLGGLTFTFTNDLLTLRSNGTSGVVNSEAHYEFTLAEGVPEPASALLFSSGAAIALLLRRGRTLTVREETLFKGLRSYSRRSGFR